MIQRFNAAPSAAIRRGFSLIELLIVIAIVSLLVGILLPTLGAARRAARTTSCMSNQRQLVIAWASYANDFKDMAMPLAYWENADIAAANVVLGTSDLEQIFWWGSHGSTTTPVNHQRGFIAPYLDATLGARSVFECAEQPWGSYRPQGPSREPTSTYGYNGYYLSPAKTPGWGQTIGLRPWRRVFELSRPESLFVFADALLPLGGGRNSALLDPPRLFQGSVGTGASSGIWLANSSPTTAFRHGGGVGRSNSGQGSAATGANVSGRADGSVNPTAARPEWFTAPQLGIGSVGVENGPHYVPDWAEWR